MRCWRAEQDERQTKKASDFSRCFVLMVPLSAHDALALLLLSYGTVPRTALNIVEVSAGMLAVC